MNIWVDANGWPIPPIVLLGCLAAEILYFRGWRVLVKAEQRKTASATTASVLTGSGGYQWNSWLWRGAYFLGAIFFILLGDSAPIDILSSRLFWVHMIQHLLLLVVIAPLLVAAAPLLPLWLGLPGWARRLVKGPAKLKAGRAFSWLRPCLLRPALSSLPPVPRLMRVHWPRLHERCPPKRAIHDWCAPPAL